MAESKSQEKFYNYGLKQEGFDNFNWPAIENDFDDLRNSNYSLFNKINNRGQIFSEFSQIPMNPDVNTEQMPLINPIENQTVPVDQSDQALRMNTNYPLFNEKLLSTSTNQSEVGINSMKAPYSSLVMSSINKLQNFTVPSNFYLPYNSNNLRRPLPQELLEEEPVYVNPKQYERIMKLRIKKAQRGLLKNSVMPLDRPKDKQYKHLSRHLHAKRRERGTGGRFLSKEAQKKKDEEDAAAAAELERQQMQAINQGLGMHQIPEHPDFEIMRRNQVDNE